MGVNTGHLFKIWFLSKKLFDFGKLSHIIWIGYTVWMKNFHQSRFNRACSWGWTGGDIDTPTRMTNLGYHWVTQSQRWGNLVVFLLQPEASTAMNRCSSLKSFVQSKSKPSYRILIAGDMAEQMLWLSSMRVSNQTWEISEWLHAVFPFQKSNSEFGRIIISALIWGREERSSILPSEKLKLAKDQSGIVTRSIKNYFSSFETGVCRCLPAGQTKEEEHCAATHPVSPVCLWANARISAALPVPS